MDLLGFGGGLFLLGIAMFWAGLGLVWWQLGRHGGLDKTRTLHVMFDDSSPMRRPENRRDRTLFRAGVFLAGLGMVTIYTGVSTGDQRELAVCNQACRRDGYWGGRFAPSATERQGNSNRPQRACWCVGPAGSVEIPQANLRPPSSPVLPAPSR